MAENYNRRDVLSIISLDDNIAWVGLRLGNDDSLSFKLETDIYGDLLDNFRVNYSNSIDLNHEYFDVSRLVFVGFNCNSASKFANELRELIKIGNRNEILSWCLSLNPEIRCFGAIGLFNLRRIGVKLNKKEVDLLRKISKENIRIYRCSNCYGSGSYGVLSTIREVFNIEKRLSMTFKNRA